MTLDSPSATITCGRCVEFRLSSIIRDGHIIVMSPPDNIDYILHTSFRMRMMFQRFVSLCVEFVPDNSK